MTNPKANPKALIEYGKSIASEFEARLDRIKTFIPNHYLTSGTANEIILRGFLADLSPTCFKVGQGFICDPTKSEHASKQCDIIVFNQHSFPLVHSEGDIKVVWPESAKLVIEVKSKLNKEELIKAVDNIAAAKRLRNMTIINGMIFAFDSEPKKVETIVRHFKNALENIKIAHAPNAILILDRGLIISTHNWLFPLGNRDVYQVLQAKNQGILITYLMLSFLANTVTGSLEATLMNAMNYLLKNETTLLESESTLLSHVTIYKDNS